LEFDIGFLLDVVFSSSAAWLEVVTAGVPQSLFPVGAKARFAVAEVSFRPRDRVAAMAFGMPESDLSRRGIE
jgi:hypothetical protein